MSITILAMISTTQENK
ncbi:hypothetical protein ACFPSD_003748 [Salmonella enterica]|nr:hypothetical protein [Salmonella enterica]